MRSELKMLRSSQTAISLPSKSFSTKSFNIFSILLCKSVVRSKSTPIILLLLILGQTSTGTSYYWVLPRKSRKIQYKPTKSQIQSLITKLINRNKSHRIWSFKSWRQDTTKIRVNLLFRQLTQGGKNLSSPISLHKLMDRLATYIISFSNQQFKRKAKK